MLDWDPVPGARTYDVQVAARRRTSTTSPRASPTSRSTRYSPPTTLDNDQFWWRVRAVDLAGQPTPWTTSLFGFQRQWLDQPQPVYPGIGAPSATDEPFYPVDPGPARHLLRALHGQQRADDRRRRRPARSSGRRTCPAARPTTAGSMPTGRPYWEVRPIDDPYPADGLPGVFSVPQAFRWTSGWHRPVARSTSTTSSPGSRSRSTAPGSTTPARAALTRAGDVNTTNICDGVPATPVFSWDPVPGATLYHVYVAQDVNFTTSEMPDGINTTFPMMALRVRRRTPTLPESQAGSAYYWHVQACWGQRARCPPSRGSHPCPVRRRSARRHRPLAGSRPAAPTPARSRSPGRTTATPTPPPSGAGEQANQSAKKYRIQVSPDPSFATPDRYPDCRPGDVHRVRRPLPGRDATSGACRPWTRRTSG